MYQLKLTQISRIRFDLTYLSSKNEGSCFYLGLSRVISRAVKDLRNDLGTVLVIITLVDNYLWVPVSYLALKGEASSV